MIVKLAIKSPIRPRGAVNVPLDNQLPLILVNKSIVLKFQSEEGEISAEEYVNLKKILDDWIKFVIIIAIAFVF